MTKGQATAIISLLAAILLVLLVGPHAALLWVRVVVLVLVAMLWK